MFQRRRLIRVLLRVIRVNGVSIKSGEFILIVIEIVVHNKKRNNNIS